MAKRCGSFARQDYVIEMITIRETDYDTSEKAEQLFSRLTWAVERVDGLFGQLINGVTVDTNRPWVGVYDKSDMKFGLVEPSGYFLNRKIFQIVVRGKITDDGQKTIVNIKLRLGWNTSSSLDCSILERAL
jgi:hypothetical protein